MTTPQEESMTTVSQTTCSFRFAEDDRFFFGNSRGKQGYAREIFISLRGVETVHDAGVWVRGPIVRKSDGELGFVNVEAKMTWTQFREEVGHEIANKIADAIHASRDRHARP